MRKALTVPAPILALPGGAASADDDGLVAIAGWQPREAVTWMAAEKGRTVRRIRIDDGCREFMGLDADGVRIAVRVHPATLAVLEIDCGDHRAGSRRVWQREYWKDD